jgi:hypothetical protein
MRAIEGEPPDPHLNDYLVTGEPIDYVLLLFLDKENDFINHPATERVMKQLEEGYQLVFISQHGRAKLYKKTTG